MYFGISLFERQAVGRVPPGSCPHTGVAGPVSDSCCLHYLHNVQLLGQDHCYLHQGNGQEPLL